MFAATASRRGAWFCALRLFIGSIATIPVACSPRPASSPAGGVVVPAPEASAGPAGPPALPPLTEEEQALATRLAATVEHLAGEIGERNIERAWNLASATDDLAVMLEKIGFSVRRQGVRAGDEVVQNLEVRVPGGERGGEAVIVAAHFDTAAGSPGADYDASGVAAVVELARALRESKPKRGLWFALLVNGEAPHYGAESMGALTYAKDVVANGLAIYGVVAVDGIGAYSTEPNSQKTPEGIATTPPSTADFVALVASEKSRPFADKVLPAFKEHSTFPVWSAFVAPTAGDATTPVVGDHWAFEALGLPAVLVTDTGAARYPHRGQKTDTPKELDYGRMARVVAALKATLLSLAND
jgi:hypothetical protein